MSRVILYVEGGGDSKEQHARCREGFHKLLEKAGLRSRLPRIVAGGGRNSTFDKFCTAYHSADEDDMPILLVDSEDVLTHADRGAWAHLRLRDGWERPRDCDDEQVQLMVTCMETWIMADHEALRSFFEQGLNQNPLFPPIDLEQRERHAVQDALVLATRRCNKSYKKGERSFEILGILNPATLRANVPHFRAFIDLLDRTSRR